MPTDFLAFNTKKKISKERPQKGFDDYTRYDEETPGGDDFYKNA